MTDEEHLEEVVQLNFIAHVSGIKLLQFNLLICVLIAVFTRGVLLKSIIKRMKMSKPCITL